ncbi:hypothetical protein ACWDTD_08695 [Gordonia sp. NPDC003425]
MILAGLFATVAVIAIVATLIVVATGRDSSAGSAQQTTSSIPSPTSTGTTTSASSDGPPGLVSGPTFGAADNPSRVSYVGGVPFSFQIPSDWVCVGGSDDVKTTAVASCGRKDLTQRTGGVVGIESCPAACTPADNDALGTRLGIEPYRWVNSDPSTTFADLRGTIDNQPAIRLAMRFAYASKPGGPADTLAFTVLTGTPGDRTDLLKTVNGVRAGAEAHT